MLPALQGLLILSNVVQIAMRAAELAYLSPRITWRVPQAEVSDALQDLRECTERVRKDPKCVKDGMAPMYGMAAVMPDRRMIGDFLTMYQEELMTVSV